MSKVSNEDLALAKKVKDTYGIPISITLGQYTLESGGGTKTSGKNNYFGVRNKNGYKDYANKEESFMDYGKVISNSRYDARKTATTTREYVQAIKDGGYATDPHYVGKVMSVIKKNNLTQYDNGDIELGEVDANTFGMSDGVYQFSTSTVLSKILKPVFIILLLVAGLALLATSIGINVPNVEGVLTNGNK